MMTVENPLIQATVNRLDDAKLNLAALGVVGPITLFIGSPVLSIISASNALVKDRVSYLRLLCFTLLLASALCLLTALTTIPPVFSLLAHRMLHLEGPIVDICQLAILCYSPAPIVIAYRRFYQGLLIKAQRNHQVGQSTVARFVVFVVAIILFSRFTNLPSAQICIASLVLGFAAEALLVRWMARDLTRELLARSDHSGPGLTYREILHFYIPLGLTSFIFSASQPIYAFFLARGPLPVESLAVFPIIYNFSFLFGCLIFAMQELAISSIGSSEQEYQSILKYLRKLTLVVTITQAAIVLTPAANFVFRNLYGLSEQLFSLLIHSIWLILPLQIYLAIGVWQRSVLILSGRTKSITLATLADVVTSATAIYLLLNHTNLSGVTCAVLALFAGRTANTVSLIPFFEKARKFQKVAQHIPLVSTTEEELAADIPQTYNRLNA